MDDFLRTGTLPLMSRVSKKELLKAMEERGILAAPLAVKIGRDKDYIRDFLTGRKQSLKLDDSQKIADVLQIPLSRLIAGHVDASEELGMEVVGKVAAGLFKDVSIENQDSEKPRIAVARDLRFPNARQYALEVEGDSMDELFKDGSTVICVNFADTGLEYRDGMCVHVERFIMDGQLVENTLKELRREGKTKWVLYPRSSNPSHKPIELSGGETVDILVKGIVIGKWEPIFFA
jgi:SOS-response transcriptional repressor LexA